MVPRGHAYRPATAQFSRQLKVFFSSSSAFVQRTSHGPAHHHRVEHLTENVNLNAHYTLHISFLFCYSPGDSFAVDFSSHFGFVLSSVLSLTYSSCSVFVRRVCVRVAVIYLNHCHRISIIDPKYVLCRIGTCCECVPNAFSLQINDHTLPLCLAQMRLI